MEGEVLPPVGQDPYPDCSTTYSFTDPAERAFAAYCAGEPVDSIPGARENITQALNAIKALGGICQTIAETGLALLANPRGIRIYPPEVRDLANSSGFGHPNGLALDQEVVTQPWYQNPANEYSLHWLLAHEIDHVLLHMDSPARTNELGHVHGTGEYHTLHSQQCTPGMGGPT